MSKFSKPIHKFQKLKKKYNTHFLRLTKSSDYARWRQPHNLHEGWNKRTLRMAELIPDNSNILECGNGAGTLASNVPESCTYIGSDIVDKPANDFTIDLNSKTFPQLPPHNILFMSGVLEYIHDVSRLAKEIIGQTETIICSYTIAGNETKKADEHDARLRSGFVTHYSEIEFLDKFQKHGWQLEHKEAWYSAVNQLQMIYVLSAPK